MSLSGCHVSATRHGAESMPYVRRSVTAWRGVYALRPVEMGVRTFGSITSTLKTSPTCANICSLSGGFLLLERASGQFTIEDNVEDIFGGISGATRIARISQTCLFTGVLQGESIAEYTAVLPCKSDGSFQGFQRISGALGEREGAFVISVTGEYARGQSRGSWTIVPKSGSGDFVHIRGNGTFSQSAGKSGSYKLEFDLRKPRKSRDISTTDRIDTLPEKDRANDQSAIPIDTKITPPMEKQPVAKSARRSRKKQETNEPVLTESIIVEPTPTPLPKRSRTKSTPVVTTAVVESPVISPVLPQKRSRAKSIPLIEETVPVVVETAKRRSRIQPKTTEPAPPDSAPVVEPKSAKRKKTTSPIPEALSVPIVQEAPHRRRDTKAA